MEITSDRSLSVWQVVDLQGGLAQGTGLNKEVKHVLNNNCLGEINQLRS